MATGEGAARRFFALSMAGIETGSPPVLAAPADAIPPGTLILEASV
jgi:hypothetical protein